MKLLHLADLHLGKQVCGFSMIQDQQFALEKVLETMKEHQVDALLLAGDLYDKSTPSAETVALLDWFLTEASATGAAVFIVPGNHDSAERIAYAEQLLSHQGVHIAPVFDGALKSVTLSDEHGDVTFWLLPFVKPVHVRPFFPDADIQQDYTAAIKAILDATPVDPAKRNILIAHQFVTAGATQPERSDSELSLGGLDNVDASLFDDFDYVALGHVHRPQRIGRDEVRYAGSLLKYSFSEIRYPKTMPLIDLGPKGDVRFELLPIPAARDMREIRGPLNELVSNEVVNAANAFDYLHVILTDPSMPIDAHARLRTVYPNVMATSLEGVQLHSGPLDEGVIVDLKQKTPLEMFAEFFTQQTGLELNENQTRYVEEALSDAEAIENGVAR